MIIQTDFAQRLNFWMLQEPCKILESVVFYFGGVVRVNADGGIDKIVLFGLANGDREIGRTVARSDGQTIFQSSFTSSLDHARTIGIELLIVEMTVGIYQFHYFNRAPTGTLSRKAASAGEPPSRLAATIMPCDVRPRSLRGSRLATMTTLRPIELLGLIGKGNAGDDSAWFGFADIDFEVKEFIGAFDLLGGFHFADSQIDFGEVVNGDGGGDRRDWSRRFGGRLGRFAEKRGLARLFDLFQFLHLLDGGGGIEAREDAGDFADFGRKFRGIPLELFDGVRCHLIGKSELLPDLLRGMRQDWGRQGR